MKRKIQLIIPLENVYKIIWKYLNEQKKWDVRINFVIKNKNDEFVPVVASASAIYNSCICNT